MDRHFEAPELIDALDHAERYNQYLLEQVLAFAGSSRSVLDFGAGTGRLSAALVECGFDVTGVEPDPALRERLSRCGVASVARLEQLAGRHFDYVVSLNVLEHCPDDRSVARALHDRLVPGGRCLVYVPAFALLWTANDTRVGHLRRYRRDGLLHLFRAAGFQVEDVRYADSLGFVAALAFRAVGARDGTLSTRSVRLYDRLVFPASRMLDVALHGVIGKNLLLRARRADR